MKVSSLKYRLLPTYIVLLSISMLNCGSKASETVAGDSLEAVDSAVASDSAAKPAEPEELKFDTSAAAVEYMSRSKNWDSYSKGILPRMAEENLDYCTRLLNNRYKRFIVVDKAKMKVILYDRYGVKEKEYSMACSRNYGQKHGKWDSRTPEGFFTAQGIYDSTHWKFTNENGYTSPVEGVYGKRFIRIKAPQTSSCGIHGTNSPRSIGKRASHGCVRLTNDNILDLVNYVDPGMPIIVNPGPHDIAVNKKEGYPSHPITTDAVPGGYPDPIAHKKLIEKAKADTAALSSPKDGVPSPELTTPPQKEPEMPAASDEPEVPAENAPAQPAE